MMTLSDLQKTRYDRQIRLDDIGEDGQLRLAKARVLCVGAGGLGCPALQYLAGAGVGHIGVIDHDQVDLSNLQRQILFNTDDIGRYKAEAAVEKLRALNPDIELATYSQALTPQLCDDLFPKYDVIIDATDNFDTKFLINDAAVKYNKPWVYGSILGFAGQLAVFDLRDNGQPCYRCLFPSPPTQNVMNCAEAGIIGAVAGVIGSMQALEAIKLIVASPDLLALSGSFMQLDLQKFEKRLTKLAKDPKCSVCMRENKSTLVLKTEGQQPMNNQNDEITVDEVQNLLKEDANIQLIDVREIDEWNFGYIEGADHCPLSLLVEGHRPEDLEKDKDIILYCKGGVRSLQALQILRSQGYTSLKSMAGGIDLWNRMAA